MHDAAVFDLDIIVIKRLWLKKWDLVNREPVLIPMVSLLYSLYIVRSTFTL